MICLVQTKIFRTRPIPGEEGLSHLVARSDPSQPGESRRDYRRQQGSRDQFWSVSAPQVVTSRRRGSLHGRHSKKGRPGCDKVGGVSKWGFLLTEGGFEFRISRLKPTTYNGLLFVTAEGLPNAVGRVGGPRKKGMDHLIANTGRIGFSKPIPPFFAERVVL